MRRVSRMFIEIQKKVRIVFSKRKTKIREWAGVKFLFLVDEKSHGDNDENKNGKKDNIFFIHICILEKFLFKSNVYCTGILK
jgi:hypothetical protein